MSKTLLGEQSLSSFANKVIIGNGSKLAHKQSQGNILSMAAATKANQSQTRFNLNASQQMKSSKSKTQFQSFNQTTYNTQSVINLKKGSEKENGTSTSVPRNQANAFMKKHSLGKLMPQSTTAASGQIMNFQSQSSLPPNSARGVRQDFTSKIISQQQDAHTRNRRVGGTQANSITRVHSSTHNLSVHADAIDRKHKLIHQKSSKTRIGSGVVGDKTQSMVLGLQKSKIAFEKEDDFLQPGNPNHLQSQVIQSKKLDYGNANKFVSKVSKPFGPPQTKNQQQANKKNLKDDQISYTEEDGPSENFEENIIQKKPENEVMESDSTVSSESKNVKKTCRQEFEERIKKFNKEMKSDMILSDQLDYRDPQNLSEYAQEIYENMKSEEVMWMVDPEYLQKVQTEIKDTSRAFLIEWIIDVHRKFRLVPEALYVTQHIIDQFMSKKKIQKNQLHLLGVATLLIAAKYEEIYPPELRDFLAVSENKFTKKNVLDMEREILLTLNFRLTAPSSYRFLQRYRRISPAINDDEVFFYAQYLQEISLLDATLLKFKPSQIAAASVILSAKQLKKINCWNNDMVKYTGYKEEDLTETIEEVKCFALEINPKFISTLKYKFSKPEYLNVAKHEFKF